MVHSRFLSCVLLPLSAGVLLLCSSCTDHKTLAAQTKEIQQKIEELEALKSAREPSASVKKHPLTRKGPKTLQAMISLVEGDVATLEERQKALEAEVAALEKGMADYRTKNF